jgi:hypothetical protein
MKCKDSSFFRTTQIFRSFFLYQGIKARNSNHSFFVKKGGICWKKPFTSDYVNDGQLEMQSAQRHAKLEGQ